MNLREFIDQRTHCPICDTALITQFISQRKQKIKIENDRLVAIFVMKALKTNQQDYEIGYSFDLDSNHFMVEFYSEWGHDKQVPMHLIEKFREFHKNLGPCKFYRRCTFCNRYAKCSTPFTLDFRKQSLDTGFWDSLSTAYESFGLSIPTEGGFKIMHLSNFYMGEEQSQLNWFRSDSESDARLDWAIPTKRSERSLPLIPFISKEETARRLNNLITFA
jgi:hypothetical protein